MLSNEEKKAIESLIEIREFANLSSYKDTKISQLNAIDVVLNLIEKQSKEIEELKEKNKELNKLKGFEMLDIFNMGKQSSRQRIEFDYVDKDKIKAKIEELKEDIKYSANPLSIDNSKFGIKVLQSLLEKE